MERGCGVVEAEKEDYSNRATAESSRNQGDRARIALATPGAAAT